MEELASTGGVNELFPFYTFCLFSLLVVGLPVGLTEAVCATRRLCEFPNLNPICFARCFLPLIARCLLSSSCAAAAPQRFRCRLLASGWTRAGQAGGLVVSAPKFSSQCRPCYPVLFGFPLSFSLSHLICLARLLLGALVPRMQRRPAKWP